MLIMESDVFNYTDPGLRSPRRYQKLVRRSQSAGLVQFALDCECRVGLFVVKKKNDEQRLVLDCRRSSCHFSAPPKVHLASGQSFASIEVEPGQQVWLGNVDIKVAFYAMQLPAELLKYFGLPYDVRAGDVGVTTLPDAEGNALHIDPSTRIVPVFAAIPMGWTHSLAVCKVVLEGFARKVAGVSAEDVLVDRNVAPMIDPMIHTEYADNFESYAYKERLVAEAAKWGRRFAQ